MLRKYALPDIFIPFRKSEKTRKDRFNEIPFEENSEIQKFDKVIFRQDGFSYRGIVEANLLKDKTVGFLRIIDVENILTKEMESNRIIKKAIVKKLNLRT